MYIIEILVIKDEKIKGKIDEEGYQKTSRKTRYFDEEG